MKAHPVMEVRPQSFAAALEERLLVPTYSSRWAPVSIAAHRGLALPLQITGDVRRRSIRWEEEPVEILEVGREKLVGSIGARLFGELPPPHWESRCAVWSPAALGQLRAELLVVEVHRWMAPRFQRAGWLLIPDAVRWQGSLAGVPPAEPCGSLLDDLRKARNNGFTIEHSNAQSDWEEFYTSMVRPQAQARHGSAGWVPSLRLMRDFARAGTLHLVTWQGQRVAGTCSIGNGAMLWIPLSAVRRGDQSLLRMGAGVAALAGTLEWARARGYHQVDLGRTSAFVNGGIQRFKRKWGLLPAPDPLAHLTTVLVRSAAVREAFSREPVMVEQGRNLRVYAGQDL